MFGLWFAALVAKVLAVENPVHAEVSDVTVAPGANGVLRVTVVVPAKHLVYADHLSVVVTDDGVLTSGVASLPPGALKPDPANPAASREVFEDDILIDVPVIAPSDGKGDVEVQLHVVTQACIVGLCFPPKEEDLTATVHISGEEVPVTFSGAVGRPGEIVVHADLHGEWHINKAFVGVAIPAAADGSAGAYSLGEPKLPPGVTSGSEADGSFREDLEHDFDIVVPVTGPVGDARLTVDVAYQACKGVALCKMPTSESVVVRFSIGGAAVVPLTEVTPRVAEAVAPAPAPSGGFAAAAAEGTFSLLLLCFAAGVGVSFTPCVLPMVPITMGLIGARGAGSRFTAVSLAFAYVIGQALVYTGLGVVAGITGALFGSAMQSPWLVGGIAAFFIVMGAGMFGFFDLQVPSAVQSRISGFDKRGGYIVAFVFGMIGAVLAGPCSGPVVFAILGVIATGGHVAWGALLMFSFAMGMGMIFLVTGAATGWLPQRGAWMMVVKKSFGVVMWLGAIYYARSLLSDVQVALATSGVLLSTAVFGWPNVEDGEGFFTVRARQLYGIVGALVGGYLLVGTLLTEGFILPPLSLGASGASSGPSIAWLRTEADGLAAAEASGKPLMIDFTAEWCTACHEMEKYTYTNADVIATAGGFVPVMIDCTAKGDPVIQAIQKKYGVTGLPTVVFARADGTVLNMTVGFVTAPAFVGEMKKASAG